jgi:hypothetical protein
LDTCEHNSDALTPHALIDVGVARHDLRHAKRPSRHKVASYSRAQFLRQQHLGSRRSMHVNTLSGSAARHTSGEETCVHFFASQLADQAVARSVYQCCDLRISCSPPVNSSTCQGCAWRPRWRITYVKPRSSMHCTASAPFPRICMKIINSPLMELQMPNASAAWSSSRNTRRMPLRLVSMASCDHARSPRCNAHV